METCLKYYEEIYKDDIFRPRLVIGVHFIKKLSKTIDLEICL